MSRIGKLPIKIPSGVTVTVEGRQVSINGVKGSLQQALPAGIAVKQAEDSVMVTRANDEPAQRSKHGLMRALIQNMVTGVSEGFEKQLELNGVGYRVALAGADLKFNIGKSHEVTYTIPAGITAKVDQNIITVSGIDKQQVGQVAADIRSIKKPEPYKGKGIKYVGERIIRKSGKSGKEK